MTRDVKEFAAALIDRVGTNMFGMDEIARLSLTALYTGGHILLEGNPGLGKTELVKTLGKALALPNKRIQFTPDLMPSDITGTFAPDYEKGDLHKMVFRPGPIFTSLLLADEINRATPKTQAAMLEAMAEKQVTVLGRKYGLTSPFIVLATQNPIDHEGTYALPEAQADRFMFKANVPVPDAETLSRIMIKTAGRGSATSQAETVPPLHPALPTDPETSRDRFKILRKRIEIVPPLPSLEKHVLNMYLASNRMFGECDGLSRERVRETENLVGRFMTHGLGPRSATALMLGAKAWSLMFLPSAEHAEGPGLAHVALPALRHRIKVKFDWETGYRRRKNIPEDRDIGHDRLLDRLLADFCLATAPKTHEYFRTFEAELFQELERGGPI